LREQNYVAKLRAGVLRAKGLKLLGHIFDFATLRKMLLTTFDAGNPHVQCDEREEEFTRPQTFWRSRQNIVKSLPLSTGCCHNFRSNRNLESYKHRVAGA